MNTKRVKGTVWRVVLLWVMGGGAHDGISFNPPVDKEIESRRDLMIARGQYLIRDETGVPCELE